MISPTVDSLRLFLHLVGVSVWVGGQIALGGIVPSLRAQSPQSLGTVAKAFARMAWPALALVVFTGAWSLASVDAANRSGEWLATLAVKLCLVGVAVAATLVHSFGKSRIAIAAGAAMALAASLGAMYLGVLLAGLS